MQFENRNGEKRGSRVKFRRLCERILIVLLGSGLTASAVLFYSTDSPAFNTNAPTGGDLGDSGWDFEGQWGDFLGTPISTNYFLSAKHIGGAVGSVFTLNGIDYVTIACFDDPSSDFRIWCVDKPFPRFAPLYESSNEVGRAVMVFGRGTQRGDPVILTNRFGSQLKGWKWGAADKILRWGQNSVDSIYDNGPNSGELLKMLFQVSDNPVEAGLSGGDSGGGVFINNGSGWKLAGINHAISGPYNTTNTGSGFQAAVFDEGGLYAWAMDEWLLVPSQPFSPRPGSFYATRVSSRLDWIKQIIAQPVPLNQTRLLGSAQITGPYQEESAALVDAEQKTITLALPPSSRFFQIQDQVARRITSITVSGSLLVLTYQ